MRVLIDTNVLLRIADAAHPYHEIAKSAVRALRAQKHDVLIVPQVI